MKKLCDLRQNEVGVIKRIDSPENIMALIQMGCCIGSEVKVNHISSLNKQMTICTCGRVLAVRKEVASHLWIKIKK
jgi:Fe2+ transport system protein FeoA